MKRPDERQLDLFGAPVAEDLTVAEPYPERLVELSKAIPAHVHLGTSSWTFPGWSGLVYRRVYKTPREFTRQSLGEYARYPLFGTVGIDRSHYAPLLPEDYQLYASQLPDGFPCVIKVWDELTTQVFPDHARYGARRGQANDHFLDAELFRDSVFTPTFEHFEKHVGALVLEFAPQRVAPDPRKFELSVERFLQAAPRGLPLAFELRNRELLTPRYLDILRHHGASHVLNFWAGMPTLAEQLQRPRILSGARVVARLMLPPYQVYAQRRAEMAPFDRVLDPQPGMRQDVLELARLAGEYDQALFVIVNNKAEGSAPGTIMALAELWSQR